MSAFYDKYDYTAYWEGRDYENDSETIAIKTLLSKIKKIDKAIEIGAGFGRLLPTYVYRAKSVVLSEPSAKLLSIAKSTLKNFKNVKFLQSTLINLPKKVKRKDFDLVLMVRVMHHLTDLNEALGIIETLAKENGFLILEFANKIHFKNLAHHITKGDFSFLKDEEPVDVRSKKSIKQKTIPFLNYHPNKIKRELGKHNFEIIDTLSVSNVRSPFLKKYLQKNILLSLEKSLQKPLSYIYFGPSIFILARKRG